MRLGSWPFATLLIVSGCHAGVAATTPPTTDAVSDEDGLEAWEGMRTRMPGTWRAQFEGTAIDVVYQTSAGGTVVVETWMPGTPAETLSVYHLDRDRPMLTHYCGQGNQPRLGMVRRGSTEVSFQRFDATSDTDDRAILTTLTLDIREGVLRRTETYVRGSEQATTTLVFHRVDPPAP